MLAALLQLEELLGSVFTFLVADYQQIISGLGKRLTSLPSGRSSHARITCLSRRLRGRFTFYSIFFFHLHIFLLFHQTTHRYTNSSMETGPPAFSNILDSVPDTRVTSCSGLPGTEGFSLNVGLSVPKPGKSGANQHGW